MWANTVWGLLGLAASCLLTMLGLGPESAFYTPLLWGAAAFGVASVIVLLWPLRKLLGSATPTALPANEDDSGRNQVVHPGFNLKPEHLSRLGKAKGAAKLAGRGYQAKYENAGVIWLSRPQEFLRYWNDQTWDSYFEAHPPPLKYFDEKFLNENFPHCQERGKHPPWSGIAYLSETKGGDWLKLGCREWHRDFSHALYYQSFQNGRVVGPVRSADYVEYGLTVIFYSDDGKWALVRTEEPPPEGAAPKGPSPPAGAPAA